MMIQPIRAAAEEDLAQPLAVALAEELVRATRQLGELAYDLGSDANTLRRHMASLQSVDHITQALLGVADVLRAPLPAAERVAGVTLEDMAARLQSALRGE